MLSDSRLLLKLWLKNPMKIGAVAASSPELANAMARHIPRQGEGYVVELGGGTGPVTRAILAGRGPASGSSAAAAARTATSTPLSSAAPRPRRGNRRDPKAAAPPACRPAFHAPGRGDGSGD